MAGQHHAPRWPREDRSASITPGRGPPQAGGTASALEAAAAARLADAGWRIAVRADFDRAGLAHVRTLLDACPTAVPWRMGTGDFVRATADRTDPIPWAGTHGTTGIPATDTPWDPELAAAMTRTGRPAFEESMIDLLLADLAEGRPTAT